MKFLSLLLLLVPAILFAQDTTGRKHSIGVYTDGNAAMGNDNPSIGSWGVYYSFPRKKNSSYTVSLDYTNYVNNTAPVLYKIVSDTTIRRGMRTSIPLVTAGYGIETQRHFYRKVYLFAGLEMRVGYGSGTIDTVLGREYNVLHTNPGSGIVSHLVGWDQSMSYGADATMFYANLKPYIGARLQLKRIAIGLQFMNGFRYEQVYSAGYGTGSLNWDISSLSQRLTVAYKF